MNGMDSDETSRIGGDSSFGATGPTARGGYGDAPGPDGSDIHGVFTESGGYNVQTFRASGEWVKPDRADTVDMLLVGAGSGGTADGHDGENGQVVMRTFRADELPDRVAVEIGKGGRGGMAGERVGGDGADGLVVVRTHLKQREPQNAP